MNKRNARLMISGPAKLALVLVVSLKTIDYYEAKKIEEKRRVHKEFLGDSPFKELLQLTKAERKQKGLPPDKYLNKCGSL